MPPHGDLTAAGVGETLDGFLGKFTHPDVRQNAASYTAIMKDAGFGSLEILLQYDDVELNEMHDQLIKDGIPRGHSMEIRKQIKLRRPNGGSGNGGSPRAIDPSVGPPAPPSPKDAYDGGSPSAIDPSVGPPAPPPPLPRPMSPEEVYIAHARKRIAELAEILIRKQDAKATIASDGDCREPRLGKGLALQQWKVNAVPAPLYLTALTYTSHRLRCRPSAQDEGFTDAQYQRFIDALDESIYNLREMFPGRVVFGRVGDGACATNYHVWGANAGNWNLRDGQRVFGSGMAAVMGVQREGVFGIVRAYRPYRPPTRAYRPHAAARLPAYALCR
jgi:hypothetical protein